MDVGGVIAIVAASAAALVGVGLVLKWSGAGEALKVFLDFFSMVFDWIKTIYMSTIQAAPPFIRIIFFFVVFWIFGALIYSSTIGMSYACKPDGTVVKGDYLDGIVLMTLPEKLDMIKTEYEAYGGPASNFFLPGNPPQILIPLKALGRDNNFWSLVWQAITFDWGGNAVVYTEDMGTIMNSIARGGYDFYICKAVAMDRLNLSGDRVVDDLYNAPGRCYFATLRTPGWLDGEGGFQCSDYDVTSVSPYNHLAGEAIYKITYSPENQLSGSNSTMDISATITALKKKNGKPVSLSTCIYDKQFFWGNQSLGGRADFNKVILINGNDSIINQGPVYELRYIETNYAVQNSWGGLSKKASYVGGSDENSYKWMMTKSDYVNSKFVSPCPECVKDNRGAISFSCDAKKSASSNEFDSNETLKLVGIPIFRIEIMAILIVGVLVLWLVKFIRH